MRFEKLAELMLLRLSNLVFRNSEIYNHKELRAKHVPDAPFVGHSDSEVLGHWYHKEGKITNEMIDEQDGIFAFMLLDNNTGHFTVARDAMGICPLYWGKGADGSTWFASEMKGLQDVCVDFEIFPPVCLPVSSSLFLRSTHRARTL